jgi:hypothetical protein
MNKAIVAFVKGMTVEAIQNGVPKMDGTLAEDVLARNYSHELFEEMVWASPFYGNKQFILSHYVYPVINGTAYNPESDAAWLRREIIGWLRAELLIGPVPIRKNFGKPRKIA